MAPFDMKVSMITIRQGDVSNAVLFRAILSLPFNNRNQLIKRIPKKKLRNLIRSLPIHDQKLVLNALTNKKRHFNELNNNNNVDRNLRSVLNLTRKTSEKYGKIESNNKKINKYKISKKLLNKLKKIQDNGEKLDQTKIDYITTVAISDYDDDNYDNINDNNKYNIKLSDFKKSTYLMVILKMMRTFGDCQKPSRYSAIIIERHIKDFCEQLYSEISKLSGKKYTKSIEKEKTGEFHLQLLKKYFKTQINLWLNWKSFKTLTNDKSIPNSVNNDYDNNNIDTDNDTDTDSDDNNNNNNNNKSNLDFIKQICKNNNKINEQYYDNKFIIGWNKRINDLDLFTSKMNQKEYFKYSKCRESILTVPRKKFYKWLGIKLYSKILTQFVGFLLWDRIGYIIQISRGLMNAKNILKKPQFIKPSIVVEAIYGLNQIKNLTPDFYQDNVLYKLTENEYDFDLDYDNNLPPKKKRKYC